MDSNVAVKAIILDKDDRVLLVRRSSDDAHYPGVWEFPGGRIKAGEDPYKGLAREILEETGLRIRPIKPIRVHGFTRDDGVPITLVTFLCKLDGENGKAILSSEHEEFKWLDMGQARSILVDKFIPDLDLVRRDLRPKVGTAILLFRDGKLLLGLRRGSHGNDTWAPPGGHAEYSEDLERTVARELEEETGLKARSIRPAAITQDVFGDGKHYITVFFLGDPEGEARIMEPEKCKEWRWFDPRNLPENLFLPVRNLLEGKALFITDETLEFLKA